jgi:hypothetical protein
VRVLANPFCLERYRFVASAELHADREAATTAAQRQGFDLAGTDFVVEPGRPGLEARRYASDARLANIEENGARVDLSYSASGQGLLVAAVTFDRGWRAEVDDARVPVLQTAIGQIAVEVPPGTHRLTLHYRDPWVLAGVAISLATIAAGIATLAVASPKTRAPAQSST